MNLTSADILAVSHRRSIELERPTLSFNGVSIDSRTIAHGNLYIPIRGERFDGHNFLSNAVKAGARGVLVESKWADMNASYLNALPVPKLVVDDCVSALGELALNYRRKFHLPVLAVAGSNGKTTTKEMIRAVLAEKFDVLATEGNLNNHLGVPLTLFRLERHHGIAVIEIGTNHPGELTYLCSILEPTHGLITNIGHEHLEFFKTLDGVAKAETELFRWLKEHRDRDGVAFVNNDDIYLSKKNVRVHRVVSYGFSRKEADIHGSSPRVSEKGTAEFSIKAPQRSTLEIQLTVPGIHNAQNALAAAAVGITFNIPQPKIQDALNSFTAASKRMEVLFVNGITILNDTYNANPDSTHAALETLATMKTQGKKIAVLADMLELGGKAVAEHRAMGKSLQSTDIGYLLTFGPLSSQTNEAARVPFKAHYDLKSILAEYLAELLVPGDIVLIKGSRGMKMEDVVTFLKERFSKAA